MIGESRAFSAGSVKKEVLLPVTLYLTVANQLLSLSGLALKVVLTARSVGATSRPKINQEGASNEIVSQNMRDYDSKDN